MKGSDCFTMGDNSKFYVWEVNTLQREVLKGRKMCKGKLLNIIGMESKYFAKRGNARKNMQREFIKKIRYGKLILCKGRKCMEEKCEKGVRYGR
ncbi:MAG: hypothetical protein AB2705_22530 [Candidatus Thiodiazotropha sp.]